MTNMPYQHQVSTGVRPQPRPQPRPRRQPRPRPQPRLHTLRWRRRRGWHRHNNGREWRTRRTAGCSEAVVEHRSPPWSHGNGSTTTGQHEAQVHAAGTGGARATSQNQQAVSRRIEQPHRQGTTARQHVPPALLKRRAAIDISAAASLPVRAMPSSRPMVDCRYSFNKLGLAMRKSKRALERGAALLSAPVKWTLRPGSLLVRVRLGLGLGLG